jgi:hypothetical protein
MCAVTNKINALGKVRLGRKKKSGSLQGPNKESEKEEKEQQEKKERKRTQEKNLCTTSSHVPFPGTSNLSFSSYNST